MNVVDILQDGPFVQLVIETEQGARFDATLLGIKAKQSKEKEYAVLKQNMNLAKLKVKELLALDDNIKSVVVDFYDKDFASFLISQGLGHVIEEAAYHFDMIVQYFKNKFERQVYSKSGKNKHRWGIYSIIQLLYVYVHTFFHFYKQKYKRSM